MALSLMLVIPEESEKLLTSPFNNPSATKFSCVISRLLVRGLPTLVLLPPLAWLNESNDVLLTVVLTAMAVFLSKSKSPVEFALKFPGLESRA